MSHDMTVSLVNAVRAQVRAERALKRVAEVKAAFDALGQDIPAADLEIAMQLEES